MYLIFEFIVNLCSAVSSDTIVVYKFYPGNESLEIKMEKNSNLLYPCPPRR